MCKWESGVQEDVVGTYSYSRPTKSPPKISGFRSNKLDVILPEHCRISGAQRKCGFAEKETSDVEQLSS
jgi:hypothetical protein